MKVFLHTLLTILFSAGFLSAQETGNLSVYSEPSGSWVRIDSSLVGKTPVKEISLPVGMHKIQVSPPAAGMWFLNDKFYDVIIEAGKSQTIRSVFDKPLFVNSIPFDATVVFDTAHIGKTPIFLSFEKYQGRTLRLIKEGYEPYEFFVADRNPIMVRLTRKGGYVEVPKPIKPTLITEVPKSHVKIKFALLILATTSHWVSFYFKNIADDNFERYRRTADPQLMDKYWTRMRRYDRVAEITLGLSYVSLAGLIYFVVWK